MKRHSIHLLFGLLAMLATAPAWALDIFEYAGLCDASAAAPLGPDHFVVANDEDNVLRVFRRGERQPVGQLPLASFLGTRDDEESDIEGAATIGQRIYWITSHARNRNAKARPARQRFFATDIDLATSPPSLRPVGKPFDGLLPAMLAAPGFAGLGLKAAAERAPEAEGGFNIEGLAATPAGHLLIALRNPLWQGRALLLSLENPQPVLDGAAPRWGAPIALPLAGGGVRSIETFGAGYVLVAGPAADAGRFALYRWSGAAQDAPVPLALELGSLRPEGLFHVPGSADLQLLSDDGGVREAAGAVECKARPPGERRFRSIRFRP